MNAFDSLVDDFCALEWSFHPVNATFAGAAGYNHLLPPADLGAPAREAAQLSAFAARLDAAAIPDTPGGRLDLKLMRAQIAYRLRTLAERPRYRNPAWYTGEAAFGIIALLLPGAQSDPEALDARLRAIPDFLADGAAHIADHPVPADWVRRAMAEIAATARLLDTGLEEHAGARSVRTAERKAAIAALHRFGGAVAGAGDADPACGRDHLAFIMHDVHGLTDGPEALERKAAAAYETSLAELAAAARRLDPATGWREQLAALAHIGPGEAGVLDAYRGWHQRAMDDAAGLVTPASGYSLDFRFLPTWTRSVADDLYFLFYRSPAGLAPGSGSTYWIAPAEGGDERDQRVQNTAAIKLVHAVHHASIGHHTQNARARAADSRLARIAATDCASAIAFPSAGTMAEGWACYAEDLLAEIPGFLTPLEQLQVKYFELRNIASCLADIRLHTGTWSLDEMRRFYREDVGFAEARIWSETTRNSIFPGSRLMYWTGVEQIKALRAASPLPAKAFHDDLLSFGSVPIAWIAEELACRPSARS